MLAASILRSEHEEETVVRNMVPKELSKEIAKRPFEDWVRKCEGLEKQLASAEDREKRAKAGIFELLERYLDCVKDWHEYHHTSEFNDCQVEVCKNARVAVKDYEDAKGAI